MSASWLTDQLREALGANKEPSSQHLPAPKEAKEPATVEELVQQARAAGHTGPLVVGPPRASLKQNSWRNDAKWLEENCPEEFGSPQKARSPEVPGEVVSTGLRASLQAVIAPGSSQNALESAHSLPEVPPAPSPIPPLPASWWQSLMYGSPDALLSAGDAARAMHLIAERLHKDSSLELRSNDETKSKEVEFSEGVRVGALRKILDERFGAADCWQAMNQLWRAAPASPGVPMPAEDQSQLPPGPWPAPRDQPRWVAQLNEPAGAERDWMIENGLWCG